MKKNLAYLDGFRGLAAFWVLAAHCAIWGGSRGWIPDPKIAVDIFIVMSGFLMAFTAIQRETSDPFTKPMAWARFYIGRYFRLAPAYYLTLAAVVLLSAQFLGGYAELRTLNPERWAADVIYDPALVQYNAANLIAHVTFIFGLLPKYSVSTGLPDWSLGLEMQFYLIFPLIYVAMRRFGIITVAVPLTILTGAVILVFSRMDGINGSRGLFPEPSFILLKLHVFLIGMVLCEAFYRSERTAKDRWTLAIFAFAVSLIQFRFYHLQGFIFITCIAIIIAIASDPQRKTSRVLIVILGNRLTSFMAKASYSVYLTHGLYLAIFGAYLYRHPQFAELNSSLRYVGLVVVVTMASYATAALMDRFIEQPGIRLGKFLANKTKADVVVPRSVIAGSDR